LELVYAFTDEYGAFGWDIENPTVSTHFIITAIIVKESNLEFFTQKAEIIRKKHFQTGEIKSSKIGKDHKRRLRVLADLQELPFSVFSVCIDKRKCIENMSMRGLQYKKSFYKFMNNIVHRELRRAFQKIIVVADEVGTNEYMQSFCQYVSDRQDLPNLFGDVQFGFQNSKSDVRIQVADLISGTLAYVYDYHKQLNDVPDYFQVLKDKIIRVEIYPKTYDNYVLETSAIAEEYDEDIAKLCFAQAVKFVEHNESNQEPEIKAQVIVLQYLLFRFMNNDTRGYIYTQELKRQLENTELRGLSDSAFRMKVIGKLRDKGIILASSQKGYKIPSKQSELYDYINHDAKIVIPMLARLKKCRDLIKLSTSNGLDLLDHPEYEQLRVYFDSITDST
jgi:tRNA isopentenyl-2-thiomethyl-A-37 hydroxylase MiaE